MLDADYQKADKSNPNGECVEVRELPDGTIEVRDSKLGEGSPVLRFTPGEWDAFLDGARNGEFDRRGVPAQV
jgi:Domain of unknown function (DUF397)